MNNPTSKTQGANAYNRISVQSDAANASPHRLIQMLIDAAVGKLAAAKGFMVNRKIEEKGKQIGVVIAIIGSLRASLDKERGGEISENLDQLYDYMIRRLTNANISNDVTILDEVTSLLLPLKDAWDAIPDEVKIPHQQQRQQAEGLEQGQTAAG